MSPLLSTPGPSADRRACNRCTWLLAIRQLTAAIGPITLAAALIAGSPARAQSCPPGYKSAAGACVQSCPGGYEDTGRACVYRRQGGGGS